MQNAAVQRNRYKIILILTYIVAITSRWHERAAEIESTVDTDDVKQFFELLNLKFYNVGRAETWFKVWKPIRCILNSTLDELPRTPKISLRDKQTIKRVLIEYKRSQHVASMRFAKPSGNSFFVNAFSSTHVIHFATCSLSVQCVSSLSF